MNKQNLIDRVMEIASEKFERTAQSLADEVVPSPYNTSRLEDAIAEQFATRWVNENFDKVAAKIDLDMVVKMAQFRAVGKAFKE
jgi:hypothetical protein